MSLDTHVLSFLTFWPLVGALVILFIPGSFDREIKITAAIFNGISLLVSIWLYTQFNSGVADAQFVERTSWIPMFNIQYYLGVDGLSITLVLLTTLVTFLATFASFGIDKQVKGYFILYQILHMGMMGVFVSLDFFLFYVFWEVMLLPMYFLIGIWGGPRRQYAAIEFFLYTLAGSVFMLLAFIWFYLYGDPTYMVDGQAVTRTFSIPELSRVAWTAKGLTLLGITAVKVVWTWLFVGFAIKIPMFPFHTWLPDAHVEAPTAISVILAGVLLKMG